jgi:hypothetical protein
MFMGRRLPCLRQRVITPGRVIRERDAPKRPTFRLALLGDGTFILTGDDNEALNP